MTPGCRQTMAAANPGRTQVFWTCNCCHGGSQRVDQAAGMQTPLPFWERQFMLQPVERMRIAKMEPTTLSPITHSRVYAEQHQIPHRRLGCMQPSNLSAESCKLGVASLLQRGRGEREKRHGCPPSPRRSSNHCQSHSAFPGRGAACVDGTKRENKQDNRRSRSMQLIPSET